MADELTPKQAVVDVYVAIKTARESDSTQFDTANFLTGRQLVRRDAATLSYVVRDFTEIIRQGNEIGVENLSETDSQIYDRAREALNDLSSDAGAANAFGGTPENAPAATRELAA